MLLDDYGHSNLAPILPTHIDFIDNALGEGGRCLVHCRMGVNRSASVVVAYLMARRGYSYSQAVKYVAARRPKIGIHPFYEGQLRALPAGCFPSVRLRSASDNGTCYEKRSANAKDRPTESLRCGRDVDLRRRDAGGCFPRFTRFA